MCSSRNQCSFIAKRRDSAVNNQLSSPLSEPINKLFFETYLMCEIFNNATTHTLKRVVVKKRDQLFPLAETMTFKCLKEETRSHQPHI